MDTATLSGATVAGCPCTGAIDGYAEALSLMANGYYDFHFTDSSFTPYLGGGVGVASIGYDIGGYTDAVATLTRQFMAGVGYDIDPSTALTAGYRYFSGSDADFYGVEVSVGMGAFRAFLFSTPTFPLKIACRPLTCPH